MRTVYFLLAWFGLMLALSLAGVFAVAPGRPPLAAVLAIVLPLVLYAIDRSLLRGVLFGDLHKLEKPNAVSFQTDRVLGFVFLVELARGNLPSGFALPAGIGDVAVGLAAPWVAYNLSVKKPSAVKLARLWNYLGLFDLALAVTMGVTHSDSKLGIFAQSVSMQPITHYPLSLIPTWEIPLAIILHLRSLQSLREP